jgi:hypothetical protein
MDIHAPHEPVHTWKDFAIHLTIVTIGLFIALMLEALVEHIHHRHIVAEARANIRQEIEIDHEAAQKDLVGLEKSIDTVKANVQTIHALSKHPKHFHGSLINTMAFDSFDDAAWRTARDTGALSYMPYQEVQRYSDIYMMEDLANTMAISTGEQSFHAMSPVYMGYDVENLPAEEYTEMLRANATTEIDLATLKQFVKQFDDMCVAELKR